MDRRGIEPLPETCKAPVLPLSLTAQIDLLLFLLYAISQGEVNGALGETRTLRTWFLRPVRIPIPSPGHILGGCTGIEPVIAESQPAVLPLN